MNTAGYSSSRQAHSAAQTSAWTPVQMPDGMDWDPLEAVGGSDVAITLPDDPEDLPLPTQPEAPPDPSRLSDGEFFRLAYSHAFERTTLGFGLEETRIRQAEQDAGTDWDPLDAIGGNDAGIDLPQDREDLAHPHAMTEAEFKAAALTGAGALPGCPQPPGSGRKSKPRPLTVGSWKRACWSGMPTRRGARWRDLARRLWPALPIRSTSFPLPEPGCGAPP